MSDLSEGLAKLDTGLKQLMLNMVDENKHHTLLLLSILEKSTDGYWDWDIAGEKIFMSDKFKAQLGYSDKDLPDVPWSVTEFCNDEDLEHMHAEMVKHLESKGEYPFLCECRYTHKKGHIVYILCRGNVINWDKEGAPIQMVGTHIDITHLKKQHNGRT